jgi:hypothetical protein
LQGDLQAGAGEPPLERTVIYVEEVYICELCREFYKPRMSFGVWQLHVFKGHTVDFRLQQFRKMEFGKRPEFIEFASPKGRALLAQMHEEVTA